MALHDPIPEPNEQLTKLIVARHTAVEEEILIGRRSTIKAVAALTGGGLFKEALNCDEDEAEALVRAAVLGRSTLVGLRIAGVVQYAIFEYVKPLAEQDLAEMDRSRRESVDEQRIETAVDARVVA